MIRESSTTHRQQVEHKKMTKVHFCQYLLTRVVCIIKNWQRSQHRIGLLPPGLTCLVEQNLLKLNLVLQHMDQCRMCFVLNMFTPLFQLSSEQKINLPEFSGGLCSPNIWLQLRNVLRLRVPLPTTGPLSYESNHKRDKPTLKMISDKR